MGAIKGQLFRQFIGESFIITLLGMLLSLGLVILLLPVFNQLTGKMLDIAMLLNPFTLAALVAIALVISLLAGSFPAVVLAGFKPIKVLKGNFKATGAGVWLRKSLLVFQFVISTCLIVSTLVIQLQLRYLQHKKIGYQNEQVLVLPADEQIAAQLNTFKNEFKSNAQVRQVSLAYETPTFIHGGYSYRRTEETKGKLVTAIPVEKDFIKTLAIPIVAGHDFTATDEKLAFREGDKAVGAYILNESAVRDLGYTSPEEAVGKTIHLNHKGVVKAVVKDFHYAPLHQPIGPLVIFLDELQGGKMLVKITPDDVPGTLQFLEAKWKALAPHRPFVYNFLDEEFGKLYNSEQRVGQFFSLFAFLAILLACLGLFGLAAFTTAQRAKEIGIRKVLGASVPNIVLLLSAGFLKLVLVANIIAWPLAWWAMHRWLQDFAYRIDISWWIFAVAGLGALVIALVTVSFKAFKVATANPVKSLRAD
jgi:putative ABC transport system permease protein